MVLTFLLRIKYENDKLQGGISNCLANFDWEFFGKIRTYYDYTIGIVIIRW